MATTNRAKRIAGDRLFNAAARYVQCHGGTALVGGPIQILTYPGDARYKYTLGIPITGRKPIIQRKGNGE
jgi:hypothetical protein